MLDIPDDVIIPPPAIKEIVIKTAGYVVKNGEEFETKIKNSSNFNQFSFIDSEDDYNDFYKFVLNNYELFKSDRNDDKNGNTVEQVEKPKNLEFLIESLPTITIKDLKIIKLCAYFISKNGEGEINQLRAKYGDNWAQFDFLNIDHSFHKIYLKYLKQYKLLLEGYEEDANDDDANDDDDLLTRCFRRAEYNEQNKENEEEKLKIESYQKEIYNSINWQDFVVVETIEFSEIDKITEFPKPFKKEDLQFRSLEVKSKQVTEYKSNKSSTNSPSSNSITNNNNIKIKEFGTTRLRRNDKQKEKLIECPITGKLIPEANFEKHIQILLRDPKYKFEKENYESKIKNSNLTSDQVITNIKNLFKKDKQETIEDNNSNKRQKVQWDGYRSSVNYIKNSNQSTKEEQEEYKRKQDQQRNAFGPQRPDK